MRMPRLTNAVPRSLLVREALPSTADDSTKTADEIVMDAVLVRWRPWLRDMLESLLRQSPLNQTLHQNAANLKSLAHASSLLRHLMDHAKRLVDCVLAGRNSRPNIRVDSLEVEWVPQKHALERLTKQQQHHIDMCVSVVRGYQTSMRVFFKEQWDTEWLVTTKGMLRVGQVDQKLYDDVRTRAPSATGLGRDVCYVATVVTLPEHQRQGNASVMFGALLDRYGHRELILEVDEDNEPALALYQKFGFTQRFPSKSGWLLVRRPDQSAAPLPAVEEAESFTTADRMEHDRLWIHLASSLAHSALVLLLSRLPDWLQHAVWTEDATKLDALMQPLVSAWQLDLQCATASAAAASAVSSTPDAPSDASLNAWKTWLPIGQKHFARVRLWKQVARVECANGTRHIFHRLLGPDATVESSEPAWKDDDLRSIPSHATSPSYPRILVMQELAPAETSDVLHAIARPLGGLLAARLFLEGGVAPL
jgi:ribosomal protein S18 acetylase RimI-like enzyme